MLVSHKFKFIFIKTRKTASTSTEAFLERFCVDPAIMHSYIPEHSADEVETPFGIIGSRWKGSTSKGKWYNHKPVPEIKEDLGQDIFESYQKVCNIRNPYDLAVSYYHYMGNKVVSKSLFESFMKKPKTIQILKTNVDLWSDSGSYDFNYIKMENLREDLNIFLKKIGCEEGECFNLPHYKKSPERTDYIEYYNPSSRAIIEDLYAKEIDLFSYSFK